MSPTYYILRLEKYGPTFHEKENYFPSARERAKELTLQTGVTHSVVKDVVMFEKPELIVTHYDEF